MDITIKADPGIGPKPQVPTIPPDKLKTKEMDNPTIDLILN